MRTSAPVAYAACAALLAGCGISPGPPHRAPPEPTSTTSHSAWPSTVPGSIPLDLGLPRGDGDVTVDPIRSEADGEVLDFCGALPLDHDSVAIAGWRASGPEYRETHQLRLYDDDATAHDAIAAVAGRLSRCERADGGTRVFDRRPSSVVGAEEAVRIVETYRSHGRVVLGAVLYDLARVGNGVVLVVGAGEWDPLTNLDAAVHRQGRDVVAPIVAAMCVLAADPCPSPPP